VFSLRLNLHPTGHRRESVPNLSKMDREIVTGLQAKSPGPVMNLENRILDKALNAVGASDNHGFTVLARQDQRARTSVRLVDRLPR
jgi:hypothetical protein